MTKFLTSPWMTLPVSAILYFTVTIFSWKTPSLPSMIHEGSHGKGASWEFKNPEADQLIAELKEEKKVLDKRQQSLNELALRLEAERSEINTVTQSVHHMQLEFDQNVLHVREEETANLKKLAKVYANMTPDSAASVLGEMDDPAIAKIVVFMKDTEMAAIFEAWSKKGQAESKRAAALSERLRLASYRNNKPQ